MFFFKIKSRNKGILEFEYVWLNGRCVKGCKGVDESKLIFIFKVGKCFI